MTSSSNLQQKKLNKQLIIIGGEGKGGPIASTVSYNRKFYQDYEYEVKGFLNDEIRGLINDYPVLGKVDDYVNFLDDENIYFIFAIHIIGKNRVADALFNRLKIPTDRLATIIHGSSVISESAVIEPGVFISAQCYISQYVHIGYGSLLLAGIMIGHHTIIGPLCCIVLGSMIGSRITVGRSVSIGIGAKIIELHTIGDYAVIGAGAVITSDVPPESIFVGVPGKFIRKISK